MTNIDEQQPINGDTATERAHVDGTQQATGPGSGQVRDALAVGVLRPSETTGPTPVPIRMKVVWGGIGEADADAIAVGHYVDVYPVAAELALDKVITGKIPEGERRRVLQAATQRGILKGALGDVLTVPFAGPNGKQSVGLVLGMGRPGTFQLPQHEVLVRNMVWSAERLVNAKSLATVLIGSGSKNLSIEATVGSFIRSLDTAVDEGELTGQLTEISIVESNLGRARTILRALKDRVAHQEKSLALVTVEQDDVVEASGGTVSMETILDALLADSATVKDSETIRNRVENGEKIELARQKMRELLVNDDAIANALADGAYFVARRGEESATGEVPTRLSVLAQNGRLIASAVSDSATVPERDFGIEVSVFNELVAKANEQAAGDPIAAGKMLAQFAIHQEFLPLLDLKRNVVIEVDHTTANLPWEVLVTDDASATALGLLTPLARQLRTRHSPPPVVTGRVVLTRALIICNAGTAQDHLPGAVAEAHAVREALKEHGVEYDMLYSGPASGDGDSSWDGATRANVLHNLLNLEYQLVHYAGHGSFSDDGQPDKTGWDLADGMFTSEHLKLIRRFPPLVVANACHSTRLSTGLPGLADEFMGRGVRNLVGTARTVDDTSAVEFSKSFYSSLVGSGATLGASVLAGRQKLEPRRQRSDWDVYQLYGDPDFRFWEPR